MVVVKRQPFREILLTERNPMMKPRKHRSSAITLPSVGRRCQGTKALFVRFWLAIFHFPEQRHFADACVIHAGGALREHRRRNWAAVPSGRPIEAAPVATACTSAALSGARVPSGKRKLFSKPTRA